MPWHFIDREILEPLGAFVKTWSADMPLVGDPTSSIFGSWYLTPKQHAVEFILYNLVFAILFVVYLKKAVAPGTLIDRTLRVATAIADGKRSKLDSTILIILIASFGLVCFHKFNAGTVIFLLQPCHVSMLVLIIMLCMDGRSKVPHIAFNVYLHTQWGTILAICSPDLRNTDQFLERQNFWFEHWALLITPLVMVYNNKLTILPPSRDLAFASFLFKALYHSAVLAPVSLRSGNNLNYLLLPPPGPLEFFGAFYRVTMYAFCCLLTFTTRYVLVAVVLKLLPRRYRPGSPVKGGRFDKIK